MDTLKKEAQKRGLSEKVLQIAKLHVEASKELDGVYFVEFSQKLELIVARSKGELEQGLMRREEELLKGSFKGV